MSRTSSTLGRLLSDSAYRLLQERILTCELAPGARLTERRAAAALGLGLSPVRDALARLAHDGLVQVVPRKGYRVTPLTAKSVDDLFHVWGVLGPEITRLGVAAAGAGELARLSWLVDETGQVLAGLPGQARAARFVDLAAETFGMLTASTGNDLLQEVRWSLRGEMRRVWTVILTADPLIDIAVLTSSWETAIQRRDADRAAAIAHRFITSSHTAAMNVLRSRQVAHDSGLVLLRRSGGLGNAGPIDDA